MVVLNSQSAGTPLFEAAGLWLTSSRVLVAFVAEVSIAEAEPECNAAAVATLEVYVVTTVLSAFSLASTPSNNAALRAHQLLRIEVLLIPGLIALAVHEAPKVRLIAFEARVVSAFKKSKCAEVVIEGVVRVIKAL